MDRVLSLTEHYGYLVVLFGVMAESAGVPLPGETILLAAGVLVQRGHLDLGDTIAFGILGAVVGDQIGYWVGREGGRPFVLRWGRYLFITPERLAHAEAIPRATGGDRPLPLKERIKTRIEHEVDTRSVGLAAGLIRLTKGHVARLWRRQVLLLTTRGPKSGLERTVPLQFFPDGDDLIVVAANSGLPSPELVLQPHGRSLNPGRGRGPHAAGTRRGAIG